MRQKIFERGCPPLPLAPGFPSWTRFSNNVKQCKSILVFQHRSLQNQICYELYRVCPN